jgi:adenylate cyclase class IV
MQFKEIEFKFDASDISLNSFKSFVQELKPSNQVIVSSYDDYFVNSEGNFIRYRHNNNSQELTIKRKLCDHNNNERVEVNLPIVPQDFNTVQRFSQLLGYEHNFSIYKVCQIYWIDKAVLCYYLVYDENMKELNRFIEIEANEHLEFKDETEALGLIKSYEDKLRGLGIHCKKRLKKSLFEMYRRV